MSTVSQEAFLEAYLRDNPRHARRLGFAAIVQHGDRRYVALECRGCCADCPGWHLVHDEAGARAYHARLFGKEAAE